MKRTRKPIVIDLHAARAIARGIRAEIIPYIEDMHNLHEDGFVNLPKLVFISTNLLFCTEIYLKCMLIGEQKIPDETHDGEKLFRSLSPDNQRVALEAYEFQLNLYKPEDRAEAEHIIRNLEGDEKEKAPPGPPHLPIEDVLRLSRKDYTDWRYLYMVYSKNDRSSYSLYYFELTCFTAALDQILSNTFGEPTERRGEKAKVVPHRSDGTTSGAS